MLTKIGIEGITDAFGNPASLEVKVLGVTTRDSLLLRKIDGLNPADVDLFIGDYARDGGFYTGRRVSKRNPVFTFDLNPNPALGETIPGLREMLYKAFLDPRVDADYVKINLYDDLGGVRYIVGYTEKFAIDIFESSDNMAQISMICPDPYIRDAVSTVMQIPTYFSSSTSGWNTLPTFSYKGTAETGFESEIRITTNTLTLTLEVNGQKMVVSGTPLSSSQAVYINTNRGSRAVYATDASNLIGVYPEAPFGIESEDITKRWEILKKHGLTSSLVDNLTVDSPWLELHSQSNNVKVYGATTTEAYATIRIFKFTAAYWGI